MDKHAHHAITRLDDKRELASHKVFAFLTRFNFLGLVLGVGGSKWKHQMVGASS